MRKIAKVKVIFMEVGNEIIFNGNFVMIYKAKKGEMVKVLFWSSDYDWRFLITVKVQSVSFFIF